MGAETLLPMILPALLPVVADTIRSLLSRVVPGGVVTTAVAPTAQPQTVEDVIKIQTTEIERLKAVAALDAPAGPISQWVADLRASFRYLAAAMILLGAFGLILARGLGLEIDLSTIDAALQMAGSVFSFMFGDRMYSYLRRPR